jgi:hypothetical protein
MSVKFYNRHYDTSSTSTSPARAIARIIAERALGEFGTAGRRGSEAEGTVAKTTSANHQGRVTFHEPPAAERGACAADEYTFCGSGQITVEVLFQGMPSDQSWRRRERDRSLSRSLGESLDALGIVADQELTAVDERKTAPQLRRSM